MKNHLCGARAMGLLVTLSLIAAPAAAASPEQEAPAVPGPAALEPAVVDPGQEWAAMSCTVVPANAQDDSGSVTIPVQSSVEIDVLANDASGVTLTAVGTPSHGTAEITGPRTVRYTAEDRAFEDQFTYSVKGCLQCFNGWCSEPDFAMATVFIDIQVIE